MRLRLNIPPTPKPKNDKGQWVTTEDGGYEIGWSADPVNRALLHMMQDKALLEGVPFFVKE